MREMRLIAFLVLSLLIGVFYSCGNDGQAGQKAPDFKLSALDGKTITLSQFRGRIVILDFWATWCPPCRMSIPELVDIQKRYWKKGVVVLGISLDDPGMVSTDYIREFINKHKINYPIMRADRQVLINYFGISNISIPTMFIISRKGEIVSKLVGFRPGAIEENIKRYFNLK